MTLRTRVVPCVRANRFNRVFRLAPRTNIKRGTNMLRTHTCGDLRSEDLGKEVCLQGWVRFSRDHGGVAFIDLADRYGITQIVFDPESTEGGIDSIEEVLRTFSRESVIMVNGLVR